MSGLADGWLIDVHQHFFSARQLREERSTAATRHVAPQDRVVAWTPERALNTMDTNKIAVAIGSISTPGVWGPDADLAADRAREWNDAAAAILQRHPGRFGFFAAVPFPATDHTLREITRANDDLGACGIQVFTNYEGKYPGDPHFAPVLEELDRRAATIFVHPTAPPYAAPLPALMPQIMEFAFEAARAIVSLLLSGSCQRYPRINWIFSHSGGAIPIVADRLDRLLTQPQHVAALPLGFKEALRSIFFDSTGLTSRANADLIRSLIPIENMLYGSDAPFVDPAKGIGSLVSCGFDEQAAFDIRMGNAQRLLSVIPALTSP